MTRYDDGRIVLQECEVPARAYRKYGMLERCLGEPLPTWSDGDTQRRGIVLTPDHSPGGLGWEGLRQHIGDTVYETRVISVGGEHTDAPAIPLVYGLFKDDSLLLTQKSGFTTFDPNQSLQNISGRLVWELADPTHPTVIVDGVDLRASLNADALYAPYGLANKLILVVKRNNHFQVFLEDEPISPVYDQVEIGYCCEGAAYTIRGMGGRLYWFWAQRAGKHYLVVVRDLSASD